MAEARTEGRVKHLRAKGLLRHATVKQLITDLARLGWSVKVHLNPRSLHS
jgi:hypothetical protein